MVGVEARGPELDLARGNEERLEIVGGGGHRDRDFARAAACVQAAKIMQTKRDALGQACFFLHIAVLALVVLGWIWPQRGWLIAYLIFLPLMVLHWKLNRDACMLNNLENWLRFRSWRAPEANREEGAWLRTLLADAVGIKLTEVHMNGLIYGAVLLLWGLGWARFLGKF